VVVDAAVLRRFGADSETCYEGLLRADPYLHKLVAGARRLTPVVRYSNYQLTALRGVGEGWALVGDCFGFVDPVFSSGLFLAMEGARELEAAIREGGGAALRRYERRHLRHIAAWQKAADYFYDGRFFALFRMGEQAPRSLAGRLLGPHVARHVPRIFTGEATTGAYSPRLLGFMMERALDEDPEAIRIR
jgi:flavin-dependent dehydrogenase